ncbi:MAG: hypothetical protein K6T57_06545 [Thermaceae bacterium]|nr:hypothetical protein [Thermaceae bacterium]
MALRDNFTPEQWIKVLSGPASAGSYILVASPSGLTGILAEAAALTKALLEGAKASDSPLLQALYESLQPEAFKELPQPEKRRFSSLEEAKSTLLDEVRQALWLVQTKTSPQDAEAYKGYVMSVAQKVAGAAKEGGFLGFGGEQISPAEKEALEQLRDTLGLNPDPSGPDALAEG